MNKTIIRLIETAHKQEFAQMIIDSGRVKQAQEAIVANGITILVDGVFGPQTATAISTSRMTPILAHMRESRDGYRLASSIPKWIELALGEIGVKEIKGGMHNKRVITYMQATKWGKWVHTDETPWCAGFVGWCMMGAGYEDLIPAYSLGAKSWLHFGVSAAKPVFGAIAVKSRRGGGHVGFVVGKSKNGKYLYILGGNQGDKVCVRKYPTSVWLDFRVPASYKPTQKLANWNGRSALAGSEA